MRFMLAFGLLLLFASSPVRAETPISYGYGLDSTSQALAMAGKPTGAMSNPGAMSNTVAAENQGDCGCDECKKHGGLGGGRGGRGGSQRQSVDWGNCNCNGSYKFPVPPLYTYQWPGRYSQQLMTDYQSPWRFPPLRPYVDEPVRGMNTHSVTPTSAEEELAYGLPETAARTSAPESLSAKIERYYGVK